MKKVITLLIVIVGMSACAKAPLDPRYQGEVGGGFYKYYLTYSPQSKPRNPQDEQACYQFAAKVSLNWGRNNSNVLGATAGGAAAGAVTGWAVGGSPAKGAGAGAALGFLGSLGQKALNRKKVYQSVLINCLRKKGYDVY